MTTMKAARQMHHAQMREPILKTVTVQEVDEDGNLQEKKVTKRVGSEKIDKYVPFRKWARQNVSSFQKPFSPKLDYVLKAGT